jgi:hypothetical protein
VDPEPTKAFGLPSCIDLLVEEIRHSLVLEGNGQSRAVLPDEPDILDNEQVLLRANAESADFGRAQVAEKEQLAPGVWGKP